MIDVFCCSPKGYGLHLFSPIPFVLAITCAGAGGSRVGACDHRAATPKAPLTRLTPHKTIQPEGDTT